MREIEFRGKDIETVEWVFGDLHTLCDKPHIHTEKSKFPYAGKRSFVIPETIGQFTGLLDKNGKEVYEGDIVEFYDLKSYCINPDCEPHLLGYNDRLIKRTCEVRFADCIFGIEDIDSFNFTPLSWCGLVAEDLEDLKERKEKDAYFDTNGYNIDDSIIGIKVIGNIHDTPELLENK